MNNNIILNNINYILAKLKPSQYREYWKIWNKNFRDRYKEIFGNKYRIYLDYEYNDEKIDLDRTSIKIYDFIRANINNLDKNFRVRNVTDFLEGYAYNDRGQKAKIVKLLNKYKERVIEDFPINPEESFNYIIKQFNKRPSYKQTFKKKLICISRHPYDIAGMSTDRRWKSCMELPGKENPGGGAYYHKIKSDIKEGTLVAYLIYENDKNINEPLARILIKPYINVGNPSDILLVPEPIVYSDNSLTGYYNFKEAVDDWLESFQDEKLGTFEFNPKLYRDKSEQYITKVNKKAHDMFENEITIDPNLNKDSQYQIENEIKKLKHELLNCEFKSLVFTIQNSTITVKSGTFINGEITKHMNFAKDVIWKNGTLIDSVFDGTWENGTAIGCVFLNSAIFKNGLASKCKMLGTWENGIWIDGTFHNGIWKNGEWRTGKIYLSKFNTYRFFDLAPDIIYYIMNKSENYDYFLREYDIFKDKILTNEFMEKRLQFFQKYIDKVTQIIRNY